MASHKFQNEAELVRAAVLLADLKKTTNSTMTALEVDSGYGIADIVFASLGRSWPKNARLAAIPPSWLYSLVRLPYRRIFTLTDFADFVAVSPGTAKAALRTFVEAGYCVELPGQRWCKRYTPRKIFPRITAIEAKLKDWRRALYQAERYRLFASCTWVLLDEESSTPARKHYHEFAGRNVGLATLTPQGICKAYFHPHDQKPKSDMAYWLVTGQLLQRLK